MSGRILYKSSLLIDGTGETPIDDAYMIVENDIIISVGKIDQINLSETDMQIVNFENKTIVPGVIDAHTHFTINPDVNFTGFVGRDSVTRIALRGAENLKKTLRGGVTYIRDLGSYRHIDIELKKCLKDGLIEGPDILVSGEILTMTGGHGWPIGRECDGVAEVLKAAREQIKAGADLIKIMATGGNLTPGTQSGAPQLNEEEMRAAVEAAHKASRKTTVHAHGAEGIKAALRAGIDCIEHGMYIDEEALAFMAENNIYYVPTLVAPWICAQIGEERGLEPEAVRKTKSSIVRHMESFRMARKCGVKIAMGTDAGTPFCEHGVSYVDELKLMAEGGFTPMQAIVAATKISAEVLNVAQKYGTLEPGKKADFLILDENPLHNLETYRHIHSVYKNGKKIAR